MNDVIRKLESLITLNTSSKMTEVEASYVAGIADALEVVKNSLSENLIIGNKYYVIMYRDGDIHFPYIEQMKLYKISQGQIKPSYCFTRNLESGKYHSNHPDLVLASKKGLIERVFFTKEQAEQAIGM